VTTLLSTQKTLLTTKLTYLLLCILASLRANNHLRMTEAQIEEKIGRWLKLCPSKVGTDDIDDSEDDQDKE